ncbi:ATP-binding cassette domain-containing protein [Aquamicrobium lusatiense]|uniref:ATP-binding cassette domain-containing protein n=1 Tax=Aquamicrobium lusatiense TaxID=89772 RepID=UPI002453BC52|nr:ATP-binding cassette domain-containing protein [Aquamicrobium lusatiense]MDH4989335.1 ATP-binding cassette domain-containing protein [Aquamicrobium lusatiense]
MSQSNAGVAVRLTEARKQFGDREILKGITLDIAPGEFLALIGRSGCGKSTLLRLIAGLESVTSGDAEVGTVPAAAMHPGMRILFQDDRLLPWKTVLQNVGLGLPATRRFDCLAALQEVGLTDHLEDWPASISGGQKQRVALARALVSRPGLLLLDEPLGALDALTRIEMQRLIEGIWQAERFTALLVTHDVSEAIQLADRVILIEDGHITLDRQIDLPRPRICNAAFADIERELLDRILK